MGEILVREPQIGAGILPAERTIGDEGLTADGSRLRLATRLPWYRSLPLSTIEFTELTVDGEAVSREALRFRLNDREWSLEEMAEEIDTFWFVLDSGWLLFDHPRAQDGASHEVSLTTVISPPYIPGMRRTNPQTEILEVSQ
jgi:hypothetical protein